MNSSPHPLRILEVGCGTGANSHLLANYGHVIGLDISPVALSLCQIRENEELVLGDVLHLPWKENTFDLVVALDVIEHIEDDIGMLRELHRVLKAEGSFILTGPAMMSLWSEHDKALAHVRRYSYRELREKLEATCFGIQKLSFANFFLFLPIFLFRKVQRWQHRLRRNGSPPRGIMRLPMPLNLTLMAFLKLEAFLLHYISFPIGVSLVCLAKKEPSSTKKSAMS